MPTSGIASDEDAMVTEGGMERFRTSGMMILVISGEEKTVRVRPFAVRA